MPVFNKLVPDEPPDGKGAKYILSLASNAISKLASLKSNCWFPLDVGLTHIETVQSPDVGKS